MKPVYRFGALLFVAFGLSCVFAAFSTASEFRYLVPGNIVMTLEPGPEAIGPRSLPLIATVRAKVGMPKNGEVFFESTPDFTVFPEKASFSQLATSPLKTRLTVTKRQLEAGSAIPESWIRMRVVYDPDYESLLRVVENSSRYPDPNERRRLAERIMKNSEKHARQTDAVRYFPIFESSEN